MIFSEMKAKDDKMLTLVFFSLLPLLLASGTMGIVMAIAPLWVKRQKWMTQSSRKHCVSQW